MSVEILSVEIVSVDFECRNFEFRIVEWRIFGTHSAINYRNWCVRKNIYIL